ncbi:MAG TPA: lysylphosphatidylglycerol synthase transmembrane domain-containing protein [Ktedonobacteraceae bacterium]|nr:lysylphosphatidylglycerol synthase transmembrane domain-containing protein [Ktedonobacteraceae bacterium]
MQFVQRSMLKKIGKRVVQIGLPIIVLGFFLYYVARNWNALAAHSFQWDPWLLALSLLGFIVQEITFGLIWRAILARLDARLGVRATLRIYLASEFVRYIPGNVWHVLTRILWVSKYGVSRTTAFASMTIELITKLAAGVLVFAVSLLFWHDIGAVGSFLHSWFIILFGIFIILALAIGLHPRVLNGLLNVALRILKRQPVSLTVRYRDILLVTLLWSGSWIIAGGAFYLMVLALWPTTPIAALPICVGIYAIAWDIGFISFITPSGLGFREGAIGLLFALSLPVLPTSLGAVIALLSRFVSTLAEVLCVSVAYLSGGRQMREVQAQAEQSTQDSQRALNDASDGQVEEREGHIESSPDPSKKTPIKAMAEGGAVGE